MQPLSIGERVSEFAATEPERIVLRFFPVGGGRIDVSADTLDRRSNQVARLLLDCGVKAGERVAVGLRNSPEHVYACVGAWKLGVGVLTMRWDVPAWERDRLVGATAPVLLLASEAGTPEAGLPVVSIGDASRFSDDRVEMITPTQPMAIPTGGSTGASKAVVLPVPGAIVPGMAFGPNEALFGIPRVERHIVMGPMYHSNPLLMVHAGMFDGQEVLLMERFDAAAFLSIVKTHRPHFVTLVPTMMKRLLDEPTVHDVDWTCFHMVLHGTAPCPDWLKREWIALVGAERLWEIFASSELVGSIIVRGDEWLGRPGTIGRPAPTTELKILDDRGVELPVGEVGEIYMKLTGVDEPLFSYLGGDRPRVAAGGFVSVGDLGWVDDDGYVYSADRRTDLIITGGANVVPAEVEAAIGEHAAVADVAVVGLHDDEWGQVVHAIIQLKMAQDHVSESLLINFARQRLAPYKVPKSVEFVEQIPRSEMGKLRRSALAADRA